MGCVIPNGEHEKYVERVTDSSRYWVLKIVNGQRHAFIGFGFSDRNDAFDFNCVLSDFKRTYVDKDSDSAIASQLEPMRDLSLKDGDKIVLNLNNVGGNSRRSGRPTSGAAGYGGLTALAPPPPPGGSIPVLAPPPVRGSLNAPQEDFADFADFQSAAALKTDG